MYFAKKIYADEAASPKYVAYHFKKGLIDVLILKKTVTTANIDTITWCRKISSDLATDWTNRASQTYSANVDISDVSFNEGGATSADGGSQEETVTVDSLILQLDANSNKNITSGKVVQWTDRSINANHANQSSAGNRPTNNVGYVSFNGTNSENLIVTNNASLNPKANLTLFAKIKTSAATAFQGFIDKYVGGTSGYAIFQNASLKAASSVKFSKTEVNSTGTSNINTGVIKDIQLQVVGNRKFRNKRFICDGEEPQILKIGGTYYLFYDRYIGSQPNIYMRSSASPYFEDSVETLILANRQYCSIMKDGATFRLLVCDIALQNIELYTSSTVGSGYTLQGTVVTYGAAYDILVLADPHEIKIGSTYFLYYSGFTAGGVATVCYATSATGAAGSYTKQGTCIPKGASGQWDDTLTADPDVVLMPDNATYLMFYTGYKSSISKQQQGYATSTDGINWTKFSGNPVHYFSGESFEEGIYGANEPTILIENSLVRMWYRANNSSAIKIGYAEWDLLTSNTINAGNETTTVTLSVDGVAEATTTLSNDLGIDYMLQNSDDLKIGGDGASTNYFTGDIYEIKIS